MISLLCYYDNLVVQVNEKVDEYSKYLFEPVDTNWSMVYEDGDMKVTKIIR